MNDFFAAIESWRGSSHHRQGRITGFCYGAGCRMRRVAYPELAARAVLRASGQAGGRVADQGTVTAALRRDRATSTPLARLRSRAEDRGQAYEAHFYPGTGHGFHNDSTPRYDEAAAKLAWERTLAWFRQHLA